MTRHEDAANKIIAVEGFAFALASVHAARDKGELAETRTYLKAAIVKALAAEQKRASDIALAIDSGRGNEKSISMAILREVD